MDKVEYSIHVQEIGVILEDNCANVDCMSQGQLC